MNKSLKDISEIVSLSYISVRRIAKKISENEQFGDEFKTAYEKRKPRSCTSNISQIISGMISSKNDTTQAEIIEDLKTANIDISQSTVSRSLKKLKETRQRLLKLEDNMADLSI